MLREEMAPIPLGVAASHKAEGTLSIWDSGRISGPEVRRSTLGLDIHLLCDLGKIP